MSREQHLRDYSLRLTSQQTHMLYMALVLDWTDHSERRTSLFQRRDLRERRDLIGRLLSLASGMTRHLFLTQDDLHLTRHELRMLYRALLAHARPYHRRPSTPFRDAILEDQQAMLARLVEMDGELPMRFGSLEAIL